MNSNGSIDTSFVFDTNDLNNFNTSVPLNYLISSLTLLPDDKFFVSGPVNGNNFSGKFFRKINSNGSIDDSFATTVNNYAEVEVIPNGKLLLRKFGTSYRGVPARNLLRLIGEDYNFVQGNIKLENNNNGCDAMDIDASNLKFAISNGTIVDNLISNVSGSYKIAVKQGNFTVNPLPENPTFFNISPSSLNVSFPTQTSPINQDFCITTNGTHPDLEVILLPINVARPGFNSQYKLVYKNKGNQVQSGSINLSFNDLVMDLTIAIPSVTAQTFNLLSWNFSNLNPFETREINITLNLNTPTEIPSLNGGDILSYTATITSLQTDEIPNDNTFSLNQIVVNSYDPNDKTCLQGTSITPNKVGEFVHYLIRFENSGTYNAQNITINDFIDINKFDISTLVPISGSSPFTTKISSGNKVDFVFENINLPFDDANNDGYVAFKIKTKSTLVSGDNFTNGASIYFDYNYPIVTNTYTTTITTLSTQDFNFGTYFSLYPNPVVDVLNINKKADIDISSINIYNSLGQLVVTIANANYIDKIDVSNIPLVNYFVKINSNIGTSNTRFIKK